MKNYAKANGITEPTVNAAEIESQLIRFWEPSEEDYEFWGKKTISLQLKEGTKNEIRKPPLIGTCVGVLI